MTDDKNKAGDNTAGNDDGQLVELLCKGLMKLAAEDSGNERVRKSGSERSDRHENAADIFYRAAGKLKYVILTGLLFALLFGIFAVYIHEPVYAATAKLYIMGQNNSNALSDLQVGSYLTMDYQEVFKTWEVHDIVRNKLNLSYSYKEMQDMLDISNPSNTRVLYITVKHKNPQMASEIANAYAEAGKEFILDTMDSEVPSTFSMALKPGKATGLGRTAYVVTGFVLGAILSAGFVFIHALTDNKPRSPHDIARYADIPTLAIVPRDPAEKVHNSGHKGRREI